MGLIVMIGIGAIILIIKAITGRKEVVEMEETMAFLANSKHHHTDIRTIADWEYKLRFKIGLCQADFDSNKITESEYLNSLEELISNRISILKQYDVTEDEVERYYNFIYIDKNGKLKRNIVSE